MTDAPSGRPGVHSSILPARVVPGGGLPVGGPPVPPNIALPKEPELPPAPSSPASSVPALPFGPGANPPDPLVPQWAQHTVAIRLMAGAIRVNDGGVTLVPGVMVRRSSHCHVYIHPC